MEIAITNGPAFATADVTLGPAERIKADGGAMMSMSADMSIETKAQGGMFKSMKRSMLGGESFFLNTFEAGGAGGKIRFGQTMPGDVRHRKLDGGLLYVQSGSFLAGSEAIEIDTKWGGAKTFFGGEGLFLLKCSGLGDLVLSAYGAIDTFQLAAGESVRVDTGHIVAFDDTVKFDVKKIGGLKSTLLSGEGLVVELTGPGEVWTQTRSMSALKSWVLSVVPTRSS